MLCSGSIFEENAVISMEIITVYPYERKPIQLNLRILKTMTP